MLIAIYGLYKCKNFLHCPVLFNIYSAIANTNLNPGWQVSKLASEAKKERNTLTKEVSKISDYGISVWPNFMLYFSYWIGYSSVHMSSLWLVIIGIGPIPLLFIFWNLLSCISVGNKELLFVVNGDLLIFVIQIHIKEKKGWHKKHTLVLYKNSTTLILELS